MSPKKRTEKASRNRKRVSQQKRVARRTLVSELVNFVLPEGALFSKKQFHGNIKWVPEQLAVQALIW
jgi:hypothetical protein